MAYENITFYNSAEDLSLVVVWCDSWFAGVASPHLIGDHMMIFWEICKKSLLSQGACSEGFRKQGLILVQTSPGLETNFMCLYVYKSISFCVTLIYKIKGGKGTQTGKIGSGYYQGKKTTS